jgi:UDP:flavonoid glycosyltransferase YjiC (YdhE family)
VVHHGGVGTTSQGLLAGVPTLIVPFAFDQSDNAEHARKIGTSRTLYRNNYRAPRVANELHELLTQPSYVRRALEVSRQLQQEDGPGRASDLIEKVLSVPPAVAGGSVNNEASERRLDPPATVGGTDLIQAGFLL